MGLTFASAYGPEGSSSVGSLASTAQLILMFSRLQAPRFQEPTVSLARIPDSTRGVEGTGGELFLDAALEAVASL